MECLHLLHTDIGKPGRFTYPFNYEPHPLCQMAASEVQSYIAEHAEVREDADKGKMFGVLVVEYNRQLGYLAAYSGLLAGRNDWDFFVPPVYDAQQPDGHFKTTEREISAKGGDKQMSQELQLWLFHQYQLLNGHGETKDLVDIWQAYYNRPKLLRKYPLPPGGTGDCCAPKLLQYAYKNHLTPVCMAEFWWGASTRTEIRQHLNYYPACRGKCKPILTWMLQGLDVDPDPELTAVIKKEIPIVYEDEDLLVVNKPSGVLSVAGRLEEYSVETVMQERYPGSAVAHRLDMGTSGLLIVAKNMEVYKALQEQFVKHQVRKKYLAVLTKGTRKTSQTSCPSSPSLPSNPSFPSNPSCPSLPSCRGTISLPLRPDPMNRPRQVVDMEHGKRAVTTYELLTDDLVALWPQTGRTHQLRVHCAHPDGLGRPIVGDELYGTKGERLLLHAAEIWFQHPITKKAMHLVSSPDF